MAHCSEQALETALRQLSDHAATGRARANWVSTYLVAQRMATAGYPMSINGANSGVADIFVLLPDDPRGRANPFVDLRSEYRWGQVEASGRKTVWNTGTRNGAQRVLFNQEHFSNGLLPNAVDVLLQNLGTEEPLPARDALAVLLTRSRDFPSEPTRAQLHGSAADFLGIDVTEFQRITEDVELGVAILGTPEWSAELIQASDLGPRRGTPSGAPADATAEDISIDSVGDLPDRFRRFLAQHGIAAGGEDEVLDLLASTLSSQFVIMAGPSGSGKSLMASALSAFFAPPGRRARLESSRLLAKPQEFFGYFSQLAGGRYVANEALLKLLTVEDGDRSVPPLITIEEANLSPIEGYLSPLVHGLSGLETAMLPIRLHTEAASVPSQLEGQLIPPVLELSPYPRFFATLNVDAESPAPARKVVSRGCVVLLETPEFETALAAAGSLAHPSVEEAQGPAAGLLGRPSIALHRYVASGGDVFEQAMSDRASILRGALGVDVIAHRQLQRCLVYMAWFVELSGQADADHGQPEVEEAADNALLHFVLPSLPPAQFERALSALDDGARRGVLAHRLSRLRATLAEHQFGPPPDFWGALS